MSDAGRWLSPEQLAAHIGERVDRLPRLVKAGKLPAPSYHLGPRKPRYDREAIDALFLGCKAQRSTQVQEAVSAILAEGTRRKASAQGRHDPRISLRQRGAA